MTRLPENASGPSESSVEIEALTKSFSVGDDRVTALRGLDVRIRRGGVTGLVGPDGAGKTTLLRLLAGLLVPDEGSIRVLGTLLPDGSNRLRGRVGYMPQRFGLYEDLSVDENLVLYADLYGIPAVARARRFRELLEFTGLGAFQARLAGQLSGGMKQKLGLACTLVHPPELLLLDEPSVGVDPVSRRELWGIVHRLAAGGVSVVWSTAYLDEAERCDEVLVLHDGTLLAQATPGAFLDPVRGRSFVLKLAAGERRRVAERAKTVPGVLDAVIQGSTVRVLLAPGASLATSAIRPPGIGEGAAPLLPAEPRFEDAFVALLRQQRDVAPAPAAAGQVAPVRAMDASEGVHAKPLAPASGDSVVIQIADLTRTFGPFRAVDGVSFAVRRGEIFGLLGPNGAGKSTTFRMLCGLLPPSSGQARVLGIDLRRAAPVARARIGYMSQKFSLYGALSSEQNLRFFGSAYGLAAPRRDLRIEQTLDTFGLRAVAARRSEDLPLGCKQRLSLACALLHEPEILFLDEPTSGVDPLTRREFWERINVLADAGVTIMVTTHFLDEAEYCDRIGIIYRGRLIASGSPDELKERYRGPALPDPTLDDAFVTLIEAHDREHPR